MKRAILCVLLCVFSLSAYCANDRGLFWQLKSEGATVYLFGSIHLADKGFYPLRSEVEEAFATADTLAVEADILNADPVMEQQLMFQYGMYPAGQKLNDHISEQAFNQLKSALIEHQLPLPEAMFSRMRPGMLMVTLGYMAAMKTGLDVQYGLDLHFLKQAGKDGKQIVELEGSKKLMKMLGEIGPAEFIIEETLKQLGETVELMQPLVEAWKSGDEKTMVQLAIETMDSGSPESDALVETFLYSRNRGMADKVKGFIKQGGTYFVVAGSAHFVGDKGVPALLREAGFKVKRL
ncbi:TraB/GumN family protein [bacterium SCSIO 12696]|nr:TraB/GumN family protein [bacterium SCSIO 12696]